MVPPLTAVIGHTHGAEVLVIVLSVLGLHLFAINVLYPKLIGRRLQLNPLVVTVSLLIWGWVWGAMGLILAVPITGALKVIFDHIESLRAYGAWLGE
jgi:predicted PurR-regulated permease PerM